MQNEGIKVKFKVTKLADSRATNSSLEIGNSYEGNYFINNNSIQWTDPKNTQEWTFWVGDTCELIDTQDSISKTVAYLKEKMKGVGVVTTAVEDYLPKEILSVINDGKGLQNDKLYLLLKNGEII